MVSSLTLLHECLGWVNRRVWGVTYKLTHFFFYMSHSLDFRCTSGIPDTTLLCCIIFPQRFQVTCECWRTSCCRLCVLGSRVLQYNFDICDGCQPQSRQCEVCRFKLDWRGASSAFQLSHTQTKKMTLQVLTCFCVLEPHLVVLIFRLGWGPHGLQTPRGPVLTVCRRCDLSLLGKSQLSKTLL